MPMIRENFEIIEGDIEVGVERLLGTFKINGVVYDRYVKVIDVGTLPNNTLKKVSSGITNLVGVLSLRGVATATDNSRIHVLPLMSAVASYQVTLGYLPTTNEIEMECSIDRSNYNGLVTIEYYKAQ